MSDAVWTCEHFDDPTTFLAAAGEHLSAEPVLATVVATVAHDAARAAAAGHPAAAHPQWWAIMRDRSGALGGIAMRTAPFAPYPLFVLPMPDGAARELARTLHARGERASGFNGVLPAARVCAEETARLQGRSARIWEHTRLYELADLGEPRPVPGRLRTATADDADLCLAWFRAFLADAAEQAGRVETIDGDHFSCEEVAVRIAEGRVALWEADGTIVHMTGHHGPSLGVARVGPVYTPRAHRGRGYASAAVAEVSRRLYDDGARVCLFTDQANPTSNRLYEALGYRPVADMANVIVE